MYGIIALMERRPGKLYFLEVEGFCKPPYIFFEGVFLFFSFLDFICFFSSFSSHFFFSPKEIIYIYIDIERKKRRKKIFFLHTLCPKFQSYSP